MKKFCGNCGQEVDEKAVVCVHCGNQLKQNNTANTLNANNSNNNKKKGLPAWAIVLIVLGGIGLLIVLGIVVLAVIGYNAAKSEIKDGYSSIYDDYYTKEEKKTLTGTIGDTINTDNYSITLKSAAKYDLIKGDYFDDEPGVGNEFVVLFFEVKNISNESLYISDYDFTGYADDVQVENGYAYNKIEGYSDLGANIAAGKITTGYVIYEAPKGWTKFEANFVDDTDYLNETEVIFEFQNQ